LAEILGPDEIRGHVEKILASKALGSELQQLFLRYVVDAFWEGRSEVTALEIAVGGLRKDSKSRDPANSARATARDLRNSVRKYYESEGRHEPIRMTIPTGYVPVFSRLESQREPQRWPKLAWALLVAILALVGGWFWWWNRSAPQPAILRIVGQALVVHDAKDRDLWEKRFPEGLDPQLYATAKQTNRIAITQDIDHDGRNEVLFAQYPPEPWSRSTPLICFSATGSEKWRFQPGRPSVREKMLAGKDSQREFHPPYFITNVQAIARKNSSTLIAVTSVSYFSSGPSQLAILDGSTGRLAGEYWHMGPLNSMTHADLAGGGQDQLIVGGFFYPFSFGVLLTFDPARVRGALNLSAFGELDGFEKGTEIQHLFFPPSPAAYALHHPQTRVVDLRAGSGQVYVSVAEGRSDDIQLVYELDKNLIGTVVRFSDTFSAAWDNLRAKHLLDEKLIPDGVEHMRTSIIGRR